MHYVKLFNINGVATKQVACIELQGRPNAATEGAVGVLGMDVTSPTHEVYRCVAVKGNVYTWELLSAGMSIISAKITGEGGMTKSFPYTELLMPKSYLIKPGDLILDSEGYLYQIDSISNDYCDASYCGTHIGGIASGDKDRKLVVKDGKLQLVTEQGNVLSSIDYLIPDGKTIARNASGVASARGVMTINDTPLRLFVGTKAEYDALTEEQKSFLFAIITDERHCYHCYVHIQCNNPTTDNIFVSLPVFSSEPTSPTISSFTELRNAIVSAGLTKVSIPASGQWGGHSVAAIWLESSGENVIRIVPPSNETLKVYVEENKISSMNTRAVKIY